MDFRLAAPWFLLLLLLAPLAWWWRARRGGAAFPGFAVAAGALRPSRGPAAFRLLAGAGLALLALAAARPQYGHTIVERAQEGRDLMLVIDLSGSMRIDDLAAADGARADRLAAVFQAARGFIAKRPNDRLGLVFFSENALTSCPLTYDHDTLAQFLERTQQQQRALWGSSGRGLLGDATNLGLGLGTALKGLRRPDAKGRALILITDGVDTRGLPNWIDPLDAARRAQGEGVKVYGIGVGNPEGTMTQRDPWGRVMQLRLSGDALPDMGRLESIARAGGGLAFAANDQAGLTRVFSKIDELEPTPRRITTRDDFSDRFWLPLAVGVALLVLVLALEPRLRGIA